MLTAAQERQLAALTEDFVSMKSLREQRKGANLTVLHKLRSKGFAENRDPKTGRTEDLEWRATYGR